MTVTLQEMTTTIQTRLGDLSEQIWTGAEIRQYIQEGYDQLTKLTGCLWETVLLPDYAYAFSFTSAFEADYIEPGDWVNGPAVQYTHEFERDYVDNANGPANHNYPWEFNDGYATEQVIASLVEVPEDLHEIERATWNTRRLGALRSSDLDPDGRYELNRGTVDGYVQDKDGLGRIRKFRVPSVAYVPHAYDSDSTDGFGIIRDLDDINRGSF